MEIITIVIFIIIFYFSYVVSVEKTIFSNNAKRLGQSMVADANTDTSHILYVLYRILGTSPVDFTNQDDDISANNNLLFENTCKIAIPVFVVSMIASIVLAKRNNMDWKYVSVNVVVSLVSVIATYLVFITFFMKRFMGMDVNSVKLYGLEQFNNKLPSWSA